MLNSDSEVARLENCPASKMYHALANVAGLLTCLLSRCLSICRGYLTFINILGPLVRNRLRGFKANVVFVISSTFLTQEINSLVVFWPV